MALLFLTRGALWHEPTWAAWFQYAAGLVPLEVLRKAGCNATQLAAVRRHCRPGAGGREVLRQQHLFDVHVHTAPSFPGFSRDSIFYGREIANRVEARPLAKGPRRRWRAVLL